ncbi:hypothetical protein H0266_18480 [Halobacillus locisalis]|uniref:Uncharacterized protein n=1 Tax=Halobacillus locisalis TaxID=220753 RepID=A0A838CY46_9BACI|nr:hypothetical protein [Halobacillus locisalis]MBA2176870.1 hypothetical protein [Halobacillus locisalis]
MARKKRPSSFADVASMNKRSEEEVVVPKQEQEESSVQQEEVNEELTHNVNVADIHKSIVKDEKKNEKIFCGFHLEKEVAQTLDKLSKQRKQKKGFKSKYVNDLLKAVFENEGLL